MSAVEDEIERIMLATVKAQLRERRAAEAIEARTIDAAARRGRR